MLQFDILNETQQTNFRMRLGTARTNPTDSTFQFNINNHGELS